MPRSKKKTTSSRAPRKNVSPKVVVDKVEVTEVTLVSVDGRVMEANINGQSFKGVEIVVPVALEETMRSNLTTAGFIVK